MARISPEIAAESVDYDPSTGLFKWKVRPLHHFTSQEVCERINRKYAGQPAFATVDRMGRFVGILGGKQYFAHRVAWAITHGQWPSDHIDHINGDQKDNRIVNLRVVTNAENMRNRAAPPKSKNPRLGVVVCGKRFRAVISKNGYPHHIGMFDTLEEAVAARKATERELGFHPNHGRPNSGYRKEVSARG